MRRMPALSRCESQRPFPARDGVGGARAARRLPAAIFRTVLAVMEEAAEPPKFEVRTVSEPLGIEVVEDAWKGESTP
jgi:hypothetical protein